MADGCGRLAERSPRAAPAPHVTLSIVSHGNGAEVLLLLEDLARHEPEPERIRVLVTMNVPESPRWVRNDWPFEVITLRNTRAQGYAANHNQAFRRCETPFFGVMNPDLRLPGPVVTEICDRLAASEGAMAAPIMTDKAGARADNARPLITPMEIAKRFVRRRLAGGRTSYRGDGRYDWVAGMFMVFRREAFEAMHGFDERFYLYCEDFDICARLRLAGRAFEVYEDLRVVHGARRRSHRNLRFFVWHVNSLLRTWTSGTFWRYRGMLTREHRRQAELARASIPYAEGPQVVDHPRPLPTAHVAAGFGDGGDGVGAEHPVL